MGENLNYLVKYAVCLFIIFAKINEIKTTACNVSLPTLQKVFKCPTTEEELLAAKGRKDCQSLAKVQTCVRPQNFTYHCVINFWVNETYEVCAPAIYSQGRCLEFNIYGRVIQELENVSCVKDGCPKRFSSTDTLQYAVCSMSLRKKRSYPIPCLNGNRNYTSTVLAVIFGVLFLFLLVVVLWICLRKKVTKYWKANSNGEEIHDAVQNITNEYEARKRRKRKPRSLEETSRLEEFTKDSENAEREPLAEKARHSTSMSDRNVTIKRGFDTRTFKFFVQRYNLSDDCVEKLRKSKIDCLEIFLKLDAEKLTELGLEYGEVEKCLRAIEDAKKKPQEESLTT